MQIIEFPGLATIELELEEDLDDRALDLLARDLELVDSRNLDGRHPIDVDVDALARRHSLTAELLAGGLELRDARLVAAVQEGSRNG